MAVQSSNPMLRRERELRPEFAKQSSSIFANKEG